MIKKKQKNETHKPQAVAPADLTHVTGGDPNTAKIKETVVAD